VALEAKLEVDEAWVDKTTAAQIFLLILIKSPGHFRPGQVWLLIILIILN